MTILGIDIGGSGIKGAPVDTASGALTRARVRIATPPPGRPADVARVAASIAAAFAWEGPIGFTMPGRVSRGVMQTAANIDDSWLGIDAARLFAKATGCQAVVLNDADAAGVAEMAFGAGRNEDGVVLMLTLGTGIGSALFAGGTLVPNTELGHLQLHGDKAEAYAAASARKRYALGWLRWARRLQEYLDHVEFLFAPDLIILGGGVSRPKKVPKYLPLLRTKARIVPAQLQNEAGIIGAACAARALPRPGPRV